MRVNYCICIFLLFLFSILNYGCDEIFEIDISKEKVQLVAPGDSIITKKLSQTFRWEALKGVRQYKLQIAADSFGRPGNFFLDTITTHTDLRVSLEPGKYQWRVQALNGGYQTAFSTRTIKIDTTNNLSLQEVRLLSPANNSITNKKDMQFWWEPLPMATEYLLQFLSPFILDTVVQTTGFKLKLEERAHTYQWQVTARNAKSFKESPIFQFTTDYIAPASPQLLIPQNDTVFMSLPVSFKWQRSTNDIKHDSLFLFKADQQTLVAGYPKRNIGESLVVSSGLQTGTYFWGIKSLDNAGNSSLLSNKRKFILR